MPDERPPILGTWPRFYALVLGWQLVLMLALLAFERAYA